MADNKVIARYQGPIEVGMVFDYKPGQKQAYERFTIERRQGPNIWCRGRSGQTYYEEDDFRNAVVLVAEKGTPPKRAEPVALAGRYRGPIDVGMVFDYEPGKKHAYERLTITRREGPQIWAYGRSGETFHEEDSFRDRIAVVPAERR